MVKRRLLGWMSACAFISFILPNHYSPWSSAHQDWAMAVGLLPLMFWALYQKENDLPALSVIAWLLAAIPLLQFALGKIIFGGDAVMASLYLSGFGLAVLSGSRFTGAQSKMHGGSGGGQLWLGVVLACVVSMGIAIHQWLELGLLSVFVADIPSRSRIFANLGQPNQFATLLLLGITGTLFLFESRKLGATCAFLAACLFAFGLVMTGSRSVLLAMCWFWLAYLLARRRIALRLSLPAALGASVVYVGLTLAWPEINAQILLEAGTDGVLHRLEPGIRTIFWRSMLDAITLAPWSGYGWGQIPFAQHAVALAYPPVHTSFESAHNLGLDLVLSNGAPIGVAVCLFLAAWFIVQLRRVAESTSWCLLLGVGFVFSHAMIEFPLHYAYFLLPVGFWMGSLSAIGGVMNVWKLPLPAASARFGPAVIFAVSLGAFVEISVEYPKFEDGWRQMRFAEQRIGDHSSDVPPQAVMLTQLGELLRFTGVQAAPGMTRNQLEWMSQVSTRYAYSSLLYRYALAQALNGNTAGATHTLQMLCSVQSEDMCSDAKKKWETFETKKWPQLSHTRFPTDPGQLHSNRAPNNN